MSDDTQRKAFDSAVALGHVATEPGSLPPPPQGVSRIEDLPESFVNLLSRRPINVGDVIGNRYKLIDRLGEGGMGQVFVAENQAIRSRVAIKVLKSDLLSDQSFRKRFQQEAEAIASIDHRNIVRFFDVVVGDPTFLVMEYVAGATLAHILKKERRLDPVRASKIGIRLCWALEAVHRRGLVHRDIKPANVVITFDLEAGEEPKLLDFGLVKRHGAPEDQLTRNGQVVGTPLYMSPEQISGHDVDPRSDVYSLGCLLHHLLVGQPPFEGDDVQVMYQHLQNAPAPIDETVAPKALLDVILRALAKRKEQRFGSTAEMASALSSAIAVSGTSPPSVQRRSLRPIVWGMAVAVPLALGLGFVAARMASDKRVTGTGGSLLLTTTPEGAAIEVDGRTLPQATPTVATNLTPGRHALRLRHNGGTVERQVTLGANERQLVQVVLPPSSHRVELQSTPRGATVYLDEALVPAETPTTIDVYDDFHQIRFEKEGFESATLSLAPGDGRRQLGIELEKERGAHGLLLVDADHSAEVWIDGYDSGFATPTTGLRLTIGSHDVEVRDGSARASAKIDVRQGQTVRLKLTPTQTDKQHAGK